MRKAHFFMCLMMVVLLLWGMCLISRSEAVVPNDPFLGIPLQDEKYYKVPSDTIKCRDGSKSFSKAQLNDDYCDCPDGSDEPGTSACPQGKFYCQNAGHAPVQLFSSRVNDGICDCCDGSDEYDGQVKCPNTCWEAGKVARDKVKKKIATYKEGVTLRHRDIEQAKLQVAKDEAELSKLKNEESILKDLVQQLKVRKEQIDKVEEEERLRKEKEEKEKKAAEEKTEKEEHALVNDPEDKIGTLDDPYPDKDEVEQVDSKPENDHADDSKPNVSPPNEQEQDEAKEQKENLLPHDQDDSVVPSEAGQVTSTEVSSDPSIKGEGDPTETTEELSKEELGRLVASRWTGSTEKQSTGEDDTNADNHVDQEDPEETPQDTHNDEYDEYASEIDDDTDLEEDTDDTYGDDNNNNDVVSSYKHDPDEEEDFSDISSSSNPSWLEKIQQTVRNILQKVNLFQTPVDLSDAARVRKEYEESSKKLSKLQSRISSLTQKLAHDFGVDKEFYSFYDKCFEGKQDKYVYKICPFKQASQVEGHSTTRLGKWQNFEDSYSTMIFSNGDKCWNGPDRSLKVKLRCGFKTEVADVGEPSRCEYLALLSTPALCTEEKLKELEDKLELMNKERSKGHDEL